MLYDRPLSLQQRVFEDDPKRPASAMALEYRSGDDDETSISAQDETSYPQDDVDMQDAGSSNVSDHGGQPETFYHED